MLECNITHITHLCLEVPETSHIIKMKDTVMMHHGTLLCLMAQVILLAIYDQVIAVITTIVMVTMDKVDDTIIKVVITMVVVIGLQHLKMDQTTEMLM